MLVEFFTRRAGMITGEVKFNNGVKIRKAFVKTYETLRIF